jgi:hypothetical protein
LSDTNLGLGPTLVTSRGGWDRCEKIASLGADTPADYEMLVLCYLGLVIVLVTGLSTCQAVARTVPEPPIIQHPVIGTEKRIVA